MKKFVSLLLAMALVLSLCAFAQAEEITLRVLAGQSTTDAGIEDMIDEALAKKYPEIKLEWECVDWGNDFQPKMQVYMQSGLPDIMIGKAQDVSTYGSLGLLADLTAQPYMDNILDAAKEGVTLDGKVLGMTFNCLYQGVYYSREIFNELGLAVPKTHEELAAVIATLKENGITPFASHMVDTWSIGNVTMQFAVNDVFNKNAVWGDDFRAGKVSFETSPEYKTAYEYNKLIYDNTWTDETFSLEQTACDAKMVMGEAAMKVSGSWSIQNFLGIDESYDFGIFPFPNQTGDAKLLFEPNITFMASAASEYQDAINKVFEVIATDKDLQVAIYDHTMTAPMVKDVAPTFANPSQTDIDAYAAAGMIQDVNLGNNQLVWGGFQEENAKDIAEYLQGNLTIEEVLKASDARRDNSK
ncbi:MAG: carbohydrate ABC transporter substrate-binding protein [Clostridia bacterium]|nr:carbohydrate ABC transporter substrate-binding protein [Clostridia bacterium]